MEDHLIQAIAADGTVRILAAVTTQLAKEACLRHRTAPTASAALGRILTGALLLGRTFKDLERITLRFESKGEIGGLTAEASPFGTVRGYVRNPLADKPLNAQGKLDVKGIVAPGLFSVIREAGAEIGLAKEPYVGTVPITSGEIAEDIAYYLANSEQINSAVSLGVLLEPEQGHVAAAGGYLLQAMPGITDETIAQIERAVTAAPHPTAMLSTGVDAEGMMQLVLGELGFQTLERLPLEFRCTCSYDRAFNLVAALEREEVEDMLAKDKGAELTCHFCNASYLLDEDALRLILEPPAPTVM